MAGAANARGFDLVDQGQGTACTVQLQPVQMFLTHDTYHDNVGDIDPWSVSATDIGGTANSLGSSSLLRVDATSNGGPMYSAFAVGGGNFMLSETTSVLASWDLTGDGFGAGQAFLIGGGQILLNVGEGSIGSAEFVLQAGATYTWAGYATSSNGTQSFFEIVIPSPGTLVSGVGFMTLACCRHRR